MSKDSQLFFLAWLPLSLASMWLLCLVFPTAAKLAFFLPLVILSWKVYAKSITFRHRGYHEAIDMVAAAQKRSKDRGEQLRVCIIGAGISGIGAMKVCLEEGLDCVCFDSDDIPGGFWRYKEDEKLPSVYKCCHIDTDRDLAGYADYTWDIEKTGLLINSANIAKYLAENVRVFGLQSKMRLRTTVTYVTPAKAGPDPKTNMTRWDITYKYVDSETNNVVENTEMFDAVIVATGRHGGGAYIPSFQGIEDTEVEVIHSSKYKYPEKHGLVEKKVVIVGTGNSGTDSVVDVCAKAAETYWVSRSGVWLQRPGHAEDAFSEAVGDTLSIEMMFRLPWFFLNEIFERRGVFGNQDMKKDQAILNKHGLTPKHRLLQQHFGNMTGLHEGLENDVHTNLEKNRIKVKRGIKLFTKRGVVFEGEDVETQVDCVIMATGYKQHCQFVDPKVVDLRWQRKGNDVPLWLGMFPISEHGNRIAFINFIQSITFLAADLQPRLATQVFQGKVTPPDLKEQEEYMLKLRNTMCAQHLDRQQLRVQYGAYYNYYKTLAKWIGCYPSFSKLLKERPTAIWHAWFTTWNPCQYRLVGPGRLESAENSIERMHHARYWGYDPRRKAWRDGPYNRGVSPIRWFYFVRNHIAPFFLVAVAKLMGYSVSDEITEHHDDYVAYAAKDTVPHSKEINSDAIDVKTNPHGRGKSVWRSDANEALAKASK